MTEDLSKLRAALAEKRAREAAEQAAAGATTEGDSKLPTGLEDYTEPDVKYDPDPFIAHVKNLSAEEAMKRLTIKTPRPSRFGSRDGVKFRCPHPDHEDNDPSAWLKPSTGEWYCGACEQGGDYIELAAASFGYRTSRGWSDRKTQWPVFIEDLKVFLGWVDPEPEPYIVPADPIPTVSEPSVTVSAATPAAYSTSTCQFDWRAIVPEDTFLRRWMEETSKDDSPEEFHFASGLLALGMALGRDVALRDQPAVLGNLYVCVLGESGSGKSKSGRYLKNMIAMALPYDDQDPTNKGCSLISSPASGEVLYKEFSRPIPDPVDVKKIAFYASVRGLIDYPELSALASRSQRQASTVKPTLIELYDSPKVFASTSLSRGRIYAEEPFGSMLTTTQPSVMQNLVTSHDDKSGFLNRFLFVSGTRKPPFAINTVNIDLILAAAMLRDIFTWGQDEFTYDTYVEWSEDAMALWSGFFMSTIVPAKEQSGNELLGRLDLLMKKLILLFSANVKSKIVQVREVQAAIDLYPYITKMYGYTGREIDKREANEAEEAVLIAMNKIMKEKGGGGKVEVADWPTLRDLVLKMYPRPATHEVRRTMENLVALGQVAEYTPPKKVGRPTMRYAPVQFT